MRKLLPPIAFLIAIAGLLELAVRVGLVEAFLFPAPSQVVIALWTERSLLSAATGETAAAATAGLGLSVAIGVFLASLMSFSQALQRAVMPVALFFQTVPIIAIAPLLVIWFGFGVPTVIAASFIVSFFPILAGTLAGLTADVDPRHRDLFRAMRASGGQEFWLLRLPSALPSIGQGLRIATGLSIIGAVVGEFVAGGGLGSVIDSARTQQRLDLVFAAVGVSTGLGVIALICIDVINDSWLAKIPRRR